jgi:hypothetical protein
VKDKEFTILAVIVGILGLLWWLWERKNTAANAATAPAPEADFSNWPMGSVPDATFTPQSLPALTINVANQTPNLLTNQYMPLFGFVGMAQGSNWGGM